MGYMYLSFAIVGELIGDNLLKASAGFTRPVYGISALLSYGICFYFFSLSLKTINLNIAYAVWAGIGILLTAVIVQRYNGQKTGWCFNGGLRRFS